MSSLAFATPFRNPIREEKNLTNINLQDLIEGKNTLLIIHNFYSIDQCQRLSQNYLSSENIAEYTHEIVENKKIIQKYYGVDRVGFPFNLTYNAPSGGPLKQEYYSQASLGIQLQRDLSFPYTSPIDLLRLQLDEQYLPGATVGAFEGKKMLAGIGRISRSELSGLSALEPHFDALPERFKSFEAQFAANVYLHLPKVGGELEVWDVPPMSPLTEAPKEWRKKLPPPLKVAPQIGDLILFNCRRPHAIASFPTGERVTAQTFIGYNPGQPLNLWN